MKRATCAGDLFKFGDKVGFVFVSSEANPQSLAAESREDAQAVDEIVAARVDDLLRIGRVRIRVRGVDKEGDGSGVDFRNARERARPERDPQT